MLSAANTNQLIDMQNALKKIYLVNDHAEQFKNQNIQLRAQTS